MKKFIKFVAVTALSLTAVLFTAKTVKAEGWVTMPDGNYYYVYDNGTVATNTTIGFFTVGPTGGLTPKQAQDQTNAFLAQVAQAQQQAAAQAQQAAAQTKQAAQTVAPAPQAGADLATICSGIVAKYVNPSAGGVDQVRALYNYMMAATEYKRTYETPTGNWTPGYAYECLTTGKGNCYRYAAAYAYLLKAAGFESRVAYGNISAARGGLTPHSWTEVNLNGVWYIVDCEMQDAKKDKYNFFMVDMNTYPVKPLVLSGYMPVNF